MTPTCWIQKPKMSKKQASPMSTQLGMGSPGFEPRSVLLFSKAVGPEQPEVPHRTRRDGFQVTSDGAGEPSRKESSFFV